MISVTIFINNKPIFTRSAVRKKKVGSKKYIGNLYFYNLDDNSTIVHNKKDGAVELAIKMLKTIKDIKRTELVKWVEENAPKILEISSKKIVMRKKMRRKINKLNSYNRDYEKTKNNKRITKRIQKD